MEKQETMRRTYAAFRKSQIAARTQARVAPSYDGDNGRKACVALEKARKAVSDGKRYYNSESIWTRPITNPLSDEKTIWIERPSDMGLRFAGYADSIVRLNHTGWYTNADSTETIRACVYQLPGRNGKARYVAAHDDSSNGAADSNGPAYVDFSQIFESDFEAEMRDALRTMGKQYHTADRLKPGYWAEAAHETVKKEAARAADSFAEREAESMRDYDRAWQAGSYWQSTRDEIKGLREHVRALIAEFKEARKSVPAAEKFNLLCESIRSSVSHDLAEIGELRERCDTLKNGDYSSKDGYYFYGFYPSDEMKAAFNDGAGESVI